MPPPLTDGRIDYTDGTKPTTDQLARDVTAFLAWAAEPHLEARKRIGLQVMIFLIVFAGLLYFTKKKVWSGRGRTNIAKSSRREHATRIPGTELGQPPGRRSHADGPLHCLLLAGGRWRRVAAQGNSKVDRIEIVEAGIFRAETAATEKRPARRPVTRHILRGHHADRIDDTDRGEGRPAFRHAVHGSSAGRTRRPVRLTSVTHYPARRA